MRGVAAAAAVLVLLGVSTGAASATQAKCLPGAPGAVLVSYARTGGFVGVNDRLTVYRSGRVSLARRTGRAVTFTLGCRRLVAIRDRLVRARFASLQPVYVPETTVSDGFMERVRFGEKTVRLETGARVPLRLERAVAPLRDLVSNRA